MDGVEDKRELLSRKPKLDQQKLKKKGAKMRKSEEKGVGGGGGGGSGGGGVVGQRHWPPHGWSQIK